MKKRPVKIILTILLLLILPVLFLYMEVSMPEIYGDSYYAELPAMHRRLSRTEGKRIILIGGSNVAFGVDGELLQSILGTYGKEYTVCPFGLYAAVGTSAMIQLARDKVREGDIVIFSFEPSSETMDTYFGATAFLKCAEQDPEMIGSLNAEQRRALFGNYMSYLSERYKIVRSGNYPKPEGAYKRSSFNSSCTMTFERAGNAMTLGYDITKPIDLDAIVISDAFRDQVNEFCQHAEEVGASVYMTFCPMNRSAMTDASAEAVTRFFDLMNETFVCRIITDPFSSIFDSGWFYDSNVHLNTPGMKYHTILLAQDILTELGEYADPDIPIPEMPAPIAALPGDDGAGNAACFLLKPVSDGNAWSVGGLSEEGLRQTSLTIPAYVEGMPVVMIESGALSGAATLEELRVPETIAELPDYLFRDTPALARLVLLHKSSVCSIHEHTFDGDGQRIRVFVPSAAYTLYRDGAGCETNSWEKEYDRIYTY
ncbi:MAG: hypothetical protein J6Z23_04555 [Lachnospiraceae bacterium]|nr:hypothetical protein [Lachnospiraceae bacterium]